MPYITCDGVTYNRASSDPKVKQCIQEKAITDRKAYELCTATPDCLAEREASQTTVLVGGIIFLLCLVGLIGLTIAMLNEAFKDYYDDEI